MRSGIRKFSLSFLAIVGLTAGLLAPAAAASAVTPLAPTAAATFAPSPKPTPVPEAKVGDGSGPKYDIPPASQMGAENSSIASEPSSAASDPVYSVSGNVQIADDFGPAITAGAGEVQVDLVNGPAAPAPVLTDASGNYTIVGASAGTYLVRFHYVGSRTGIRDDLWGVVNGTATNFVLSGSVSGINVVMGQGRILSGTVRDSSSNPIAGATVYMTQLVSGTDTPAATFTTTTDSLGHYQLISAPYGSRWIFEFLKDGWPYLAWPGYSYYYFPGILDLSAVYGQSGIDVVIPMSSTIQGTLRLATLPVTQFSASDFTVEVEVFDTANNVWFRTGDIYPVAADGTYSIPNLFPDNYRIRAAYSGQYGTGATESATVAFPDEAMSATANVTVTLDNLAPGSLVRSSSGTQVYLVDGFSRLVPVTSTATAVDAGFSGTVTVVSASAFSGYSIAASPLGNVLLCGGTDRYFAADSKLYPVLAPLVSGMPATNLDLSTCSVPAHSTTTIQGALLVQGNVGGTTYFVTAAGVKRPLLAASAGTALAAPSPAVVVHTSSVFLNSLPVGASVIPPGSLVKSNTASQVYLADGFTRLLPVWVTTTVTDAGISATSFTVPQSDLAGMTVSATPTRNVIICPTQTYFAGSGKVWPVAPSIVANLTSMTLQATTCAALPKSGQQIAHALFVKTPSDPWIYNITPGGSKRPVIVSTMMAPMAAPDPVVILNVGDIVLAPLRQGVDLVPAGTIIRLGWDTVPLLVDGAGGTFKLRSTESVTDFGFSAGSHITNTVTYNTMPPAPNGLNNVVSCAGVVYIAGKVSDVGQLWKISPAQAGSIPVTVLPSTLCAFIVKNSAAPAANILLKASNGSTIYSIESGKKRPIASSATATAMAAGIPYPYLTVNPDFLASVPTGTTIP